MGFLGLNIDVLRSELQFSAPRPGHMDRDLRADGLAAPGTRKPAKFRRFPIFAITYSAD
jgi:hypothetical protein